MHIHLNNIMIFSTTQQASPTDIENNKEKIYIKIDGQTLAARQSPSPSLLHLWEEPLASRLPSPSKTETFTGTTSVSSRAATCPILHLQVGHCLRHFPSSSEAVPLMWTTALVVRLPPCQFNNHNSNWRIIHKQARPRHLQQKQCTSNIFLI